MSQTTEPELHQEIQLKRDVDAVQIPSGVIIRLEKGMPVMITQALGGTYTVATNAGLAQISGQNADALGIEPQEQPESAAASGEANEEQVWEVLKTCYDPEIPVNIVDLGLVYDCNITRDNGQRRVDVKMTLTAPGCGMGPAIAAEARQKILSLDGVDEAEVEMVWDPPWNQEMISEEGKMKLGLI